MKKIVLYGKTRLNKTKIWSAWVVEKGQSGHPEAHYEWGQLDGKQQLSIDIIKKGVNKGKANETTPYEQAQLEIERKAKKKREEGYTEELHEVDEQEQTIDFTKPLPKNLCFYKPVNSLPENKIKKLEKDQKGISNTYKIVKRDGMMYVVRKTETFGVEIYSRRMDLSTAKFPHLIECFEGLPNDTILLGEMVIINEDGTDNFNAVSQICRSDPEKAIERQAELGKVKYYMWDLAFYEGENFLTRHNYSERYNSLIDLCINGDIKNVAPNTHGMYDENYMEGEEDYTRGLDYVMMPERIYGTHQEALEIVKRRKLEGLVVWDALAKIESGKELGFNGKAYRPNVVWKLKPKYQDDFVVRFNPDEGIGEYGKGKNNGKVKSVFTYQIHNGEEVCLGKCGGGLTDAQRDFYTTADYPRVWDIEYDSIQPETGALRFPVFKADRTLIGDKSVEECLMSDEIKQARGVK